MQSKTIQFKTIVVLILLIGTASLFAVEEGARGRNRSERRRPETRQQLRGDRGREGRGGGDFDGPLFGRGMDDDRMHPRAGGLIPEPVREKLNLTEKQKEQLAKIYKEQGEEIKTLSEEMSELREGLTEAVFAKAKETEIRKIASKMGSLIGDIAVMRSSGYAVLSDVLTDEQFEIIAEFRENHFKGAGDFHRRMKNQRERRGEGIESGRRERRGEGGESGRRERRGEGIEPGRRGEGGRGDPGKMFDMRDANDDGKLTPDEMGGKEKSERFFNMFDTDKDGAVTVEEFCKIAEQQGQRKGRRERDDDDDDE